MPSRAISAPSPVAPPPLSHHHDKTTRTFPLLTVAGAGACFSLFITLSVCFCKSSRKRQPPPPGDPSSSSSSSHTPREFSYSTLRRATASFSPANRLGQGGFGAVFRGTFSSGENVAVKVMDSGSLQGEAEFQNELFFAARLDSPHVVPVIGFSHDRKRRRLLLVYRLMDNGNLQDALLHRRCPELMDWGKRFSVAVNVAEGIEHLHGLERPVIHGDIKPSNVLLDKLFSAKIADFGLARVKPEHSCGISSTPSMRGTVCYAAPEYCNLDNIVSEKCDVYSYGVLLLVLVSGRRPLEMTGSASEIQRANLMSWARKLARRGKLVDLVDQKLQNLDQEQAVLCIKVALQCLQRLPVSRPSMKQVLGMLKGEVSLP
ncbi:BnaA03g47360D [Brassica napus]|uniref:BnaA03g47360D protein n=1 Tax=Brassica napus TaxID=3708 RepID=A0A078IFM4_BRANA|nr:BnaA03g47360D [Brassica napus]